jgi:hypothetical protein
MTEDFDDRGLDGGLGDINQMCLEHRTGIYNRSLEAIIRCLRVTCVFDNLVRGSWYWTSVSQISSKNRRRNVVLVVDGKLMTVLLG